MKFSKEELELIKNFKESIQFSKVAVPARKGVTFKEKAHCTDVKAAKEFTNLWEAKFGK